MKSKFFILLFLLIIGNNTFSQIDSTHTARNVIYLEVLGIGGYGSVNYERVVYHKKYFMLALRFGLSTYHIKDYTNKFNPDILVPFAINGSYGKNHKLDYGTGVTFSNIVYADFTKFKPKRTTSFITNFHIGYRYQKNTGGLIFRCVYSPIIEYNKYYRHWAGISLGYAF